MSDDHSTCDIYAEELSLERDRLIKLLLEAAEWLKPDIGMDRELQNLYGRIRREVGTPTSET